MCHLVESRAAAQIPLVLCGVISGLFELVIQPGDAEIGVTQ